MSSYGYRTDEIVVTTGSNLRFGLNTNATIDELTYNNEDGSEYLKLVINIDDNKVQIRKYKIERVMIKNDTITDPKNPEFIKAELDLSAWVVHILGCFYDKETLKNILNKDFGSFSNYGKTIQSLITEEHKSIKLDVFLQYQWKINANANRTFLSIPSKMKYGKWICKHIDGNFEELKDNKGLRYVDEENNTKHIFVRNKWFMESNFAKLQVEDEDPSDSMDFPSTQASDDKNDSSKPDLEYREPEW